jgi:hypothetical protein
MGLARHNPGGEVRLGLSGTAGSAVLYSAIVLFGVGSASPSALGAAGDRYPSVVLIPQHADTVSGSVQRLPQASPEPGRHRSRVRPKRQRIRVGSTPSPAPSPAESPPPPVPPRGKESTSPSVGVLAAAPVAAQLPGVTAPTVPVPEVTLPAPLPELPVPPLPLPELPVPPLPLDLPG